MDQAYKHCQSCGMPMKKDEAGGGSNRDGSKSKVYCSKCYEQGEFRNPEINNPEKMQEFVKGKMKEMGFPGFLATMFTKGIPKLKRWNS